MYIYFSSERICNIELYETNQNQVGRSGAVQMGMGSITIPSPRENSVFVSKLNILRSTPLSVKTAVRQTPPELPSRVTACPMAFV